MDSLTLNRRTEGMWVRHEGRDVVWCSKNGVWMEDARTRVLRDYKKYEEKGCRDRAPPSNGAHDSFRARAK